MQATLNSAYGALEAGCHRIKLGLSETVHKLEMVRIDPEGYQKICLLALAIFEGYNCYFQTKYLPHLIEFLDVANAFDFYGFLKIPYYFFYPLHPDKIDPLPTLNSLKAALCRSWRVASDPSIRAFAKQTLENYFQDLVDNDFACKNEAQFNRGLHQQILKELNQLTPEQRAVWNESDISLAGFKCTFLQNSLPTTIVNISNGLVDMACGAWFLNYWEVIDLSKYANQIGQYKAFSWVPTHDLDDWIRGGLCLSFAINAVQAVYTLLKENPGPVEAKRCWWQIAVATTEFAFNFSVLFRFNPCTIIFLTVIAKGTGVLCVMFQPATVYFEAT